MKLKLRLSYDESHDAWYVSLNSFLMLSQIDEWCVQQLGPDNQSWEWQKAPRGYLFKDKTWALMLMATWSEA